MSEWQPKATMPKDEDGLWVWGPDMTMPDSIKYALHPEEIAQELGDDGYWRYVDENLNDIEPDLGMDKYTHWMKPVLPSETQEGD